MEKNKNYILIDCDNVDSMSDKISHIVVDIKNNKFALLSEANEINDIDDLWIEIQEEEYKVCYILGTIILYYAFDCNYYPKKSNREIDINDIFYMENEHFVDFSDLKELLNDEIYDDENLKTLKEIKEELL